MVLLPYLFRLKPIHVPNVIAAKSFLRRFVPDSVESQFASDYNKWCIL